MWIIIKKGDRIMMYSPIKLEKEVNIEQMIAVQYFEYERDFTFLGERHDFWEIIYADRDKLAVTIRSTELLLEPGQFCLISPMAFHAIHPVGGKAANAVLISFVCDNERLFKSADRAIQIGNEKKEYITRLIEASREAFVTPLGEPDGTRLVKKTDAPPGAENLVQIYLELFLLSCIREDVERPASVSPLTYTANTALSTVCSYLESNVCAQIDFDQLCKRFNMSKTSMKALFRENIGIGAMEYFSRCKIDCAKHLIREKEMNFTQISDYLGFATPQYFSRRFKEVSGMTPSEYMRSVIRN